MSAVSNLLRQTGSVPVKMLRLISENIGITESYDGYYPWPPINTLIKGIHGDQSYGK